MSANFHSLITLSLADILENLFLPQQGSEGGIWLTTEVVASNVTVQGLYGYWTPLVLSAPESYLSELQCIPIPGAFPRDTIVVQPASKAYSERPLKFTTEVVSETRACAFLSDMSFPQQKDQDGKVFISQETPDVGLIKPIVHPNKTDD